MERKRLWRIRERLNRGTYGSRDERDLDQSEDDVRWLLGVATAASRVDNTLGVMERPGVYEHDSECVETLGNLRTALGEGE